MQNKQTTLGYDIASLASLTLIGLTGPVAWRTGESYSTVLATLGGISSLGNVLKSYQCRTGKPKNFGFQRKK